MDRRGETWPSTLSGSGRRKCASAIAAYQELTNSPNTVIKVRASALLEAPTTLEPLPSRPDPVEESAVPDLGHLQVPATPSIEATPATFSGDS